jgi:hypothetical protein
MNSNVIFSNYLITRCSVNISDNSPLSLIILHNIIIIRIYRENYGMRSKSYFHGISFVYTSNAETNQQARVQTRNLVQ